MFTTPGPNLSYEALSCLESGGRSFSGHSSLSVPEHESSDLG